MSTFDDVIVEAKRCIDVATVKTGEAIDSSKIQFEKMQIRTRLRNLYEIMGKLSYEAKIGHSDNRQAIEKVTIKIMEARDSLKNAEYKLQATRTIKCKHCGKKNAPLSSYCSDCGEILE